MMLKFWIILVIATAGYSAAVIPTVSDAFEGSVDAVCSESVTTVSGRYAPQGPICGNRLLFSEEFENEFNTDLWMHEVTMNGGGVSF